MIQRTAALLKRWASYKPSTPLPVVITDLPEIERLQLQDADPELHSLLSGTAPAELELSAIDGTLPSAPPAPPSPQEQAQQEAESWLAANGNPWGMPASYSPTGELMPGVQPNFTAQLWMQSNAPELAAKLQSASVAADPRDAQTRSREQFEQQQNATAAAASARLTSLVASGMGRLHGAPQL
ncbi:hypothetical protein [Synechococcus sp. 1G10]|uniref:hypothetical protein n=1 Tax=Synechococcus sp. 1G10 TaxID=2025605 RepID=UPI000B981927|nr:hypothetical protein [Synechococcus sp. 1G10]